MDRRAFLATTGAAAAASVAGCLGRGLSDEDFDIGMSANAFLPEEYEIDVGETVVWGNNGSRGHTVTAYENSIPEDATYFASGGYDDEGTARDDWHNTAGGNIPPGETFAHTFNTPGDHHYVCIPHEPGGMIGVIRVREP
ncbi:halocyanin [Natronomonas pharaonis DSM 2160]|uniref:Halocyanin n=1 Tax=Natronomonas pharaonis (strain ATCC 35678 / DSM 2160 / CIP 103997 / JCM 8858 / NBRC 14720 / NCIMB 2260 / Gabara) TaxID=348780 RepID=A0A1U7EX63_NATPD|nr:plastocyanin/azurin family copper-binding protein [Natronomonas pharaonis]CAI49707.1 halocyanin [Natronomonas pharaonis DSM 2160]